MQYLKMLLRKKKNSPADDEPENEHNTQEENAEHGFNALYAKMKPATPQKTFELDTTDPTEELYQQWKKTGKVGTQRGLNARNNGLLQLFHKRFKKENG